MIISTLEELRLYFPAHALDSIDTMSGFIDNSENDVLKEKLGTALYNKLVAYYKTIEPDDLIDRVQSNEVAEYYDRLLLLCQRIVAYDAFSRAIGVQVLSLNAAGVNVATAEDYAKPDKDAIETYRLTCVREMHAAVNRLLSTLEEWTKETTTLPTETFPSDDEEDDDEEETSSATTTEETATVDTDEKEIVKLWKQSRFYYDAADLLIPNAVTLQQYLDFYENREKFIQMLPDLRYIHEDVLGDALGEDFLVYLTLYANNGTTNNTIVRSVHRLRKAMARFLVERTQVIKSSNDAKALAHDEAVHILQAAIEYMTAHQKEFDVDKVKLASFYVAPVATEDSDSTDNTCCKEKEHEGFANNRKGNTFFVTPHLY